MRDVLKKHVGMYLTLKHDNECVVYSSTTVVLRLVNGGTKRREYEIPNASSHAHTEEQPPVEGHGQEHQNVCHTNLHRTQDRLYGTHHPNLEPPTFKYISQDTEVLCVPLIIQTKLFIFLPQTDYNDGCWVYDHSYELLWVGG